MAEPVRWEIVETLRAGSRCACELVEGLAIPAPLLSHHMKVLRTVGLVEARRLGRRVEYTLDVAALDDLARALAGRVDPLVGAGVDAR